MVNLGAEVVAPATRWRGCASAVLGLVCDKATMAVDGATGEDEAGGCGDMLQANSVGLGGQNWVMGFSLGTAYAHTTSVGLFCHFAKWW